MENTSPAKQFLAKYKYEGPDQENGIIYNSVKVLGWPKTILLGFQHFEAMSGATLAVPLLVATYFIGMGARIQQALLAAGVATLVFQLLTFAKVPIFLGSSFAFLGGYQTVARFSDGIYADMDPFMKFRYASGGVVVAGGLYLVLVLLIKLLGRERVLRYLPPVVTGPVIMCIGASLFGSAWNSMSNNFPLALCAVAMVIVFSVYAKDDSMLKIVPILAAALGTYAVALVAMQLGLTNPDGSAIIDFSAMQGAKVVGTPSLSLPRFELNAIISMSVCALPAMVEHVGDINAISMAAKRAYQVYLARTLAGDGIGTAIAAAICAFANTSYGECTAVVAITKNADPRGHRIAAYLAILVSFSPVICSAIATMPAAIVGGISACLYAMIVVVGWRNLVDNKVNFMNNRNMWVGGVIFFCGIVITYVTPEGRVSFQIGDGQAIYLTGLALASILGILLNAIFNVWSPTGRALAEKEAEEAKLAQSYNRGIAIGAEVLHAEEIGADTKRVKSKVISPPKS